MQGKDAVVIAAGPLASPELTESLMAVVGDERLYFYDAIAPIISADSVDYDKAFWGSRWKPEDDDYLNCPMNETEYKAFVKALLEGEKVKPRGFEKEKHFEACLPVEAMAERGEMTLAFGPLKPVGFTDPKHRGAALLPSSSCAPRTGTRPPSTWWGSRPSSSTRSRKSASFA